MLVTGDSVPEDEQLNSSKDVMSDSMTPSSSLQTLPAVMTASITDDERQKWEIEKQMLFQQLDDKVRARSKVAHKSDEVDLYHS